MSGFNAEIFVNWKKNQEMYSFDFLPKSVLLSPQKASFKRLKKMFSKNLKGLTGENLLFNERLLLSTGFGTGAPSLIAHCEELRILGVERFFFIGMAGRLSQNIKEGEIHFISEAISENGITNAYQKDEIQKVKPILDLGFEHSTCWSTDSPFRETSNKIKKYKLMNAEFVDMEIAGLYSFANFYGLSANAFVVGADLVDENKWQAVKDFSILNENLAITAQKIAHKI